MTTDTNDTKAFTVRVDAELAHKMRVMAAEEGKSREQWIREALQLVVDRVEAQRAG